MSKQELNSLGAEVYETKIDFAELDPFARRSKLAYGSETAMRTAYPKTVQIASPGNTEIRDFIERDDSAKAQFISVRGTASHRNIKEDVQVKVVEDRWAGIPDDSCFDAAAQAVYGDARPT